jgi:RNA polymerase sigma-70 factor (ECF subfamily)
MSFLTSYPESPTRNFKPKTPNWNSSLKPHQFFLLKTTDYQDINRSLVERCKTGDRKAQYEIYKLYSKAMYNVSLRICGNTAEAEDILQEAFLNAFQNLHAFKHESTFGSWLKRIVVNQAVGVLRKRKLETDMLGDDRDFADTPEGIDEEEIQYEVGKLKSAMQKLPEGYKVVLSLYLFEGYDHAEIAEVLGISEATSKTQYLRAKRKLTEILKNR